MNEKEIAEIRRRFRADRGTITHVRGCYVNEQKEIVAQFDQSLTLMPQEEAEKMLAVLKKTLSGTVGKNLINLSFSTAQVVDSEEHRLLMTLRDTKLEEEEAVQRFFETVIPAVALEGTYLILLCQDTYDVPFRSKDGQKLEDASEEVFSYILCSICPVKMTKPALCYHIPENQFRSLPPDWLVSPPQAGFLFPAFDDRSTNLYGALYYTRDTADSQEELAQAVFHLPLPMPAQEQKETFQEILTQSLAEACSYDVLQTVHDQLCQRMEEHKESRDPEPLTVSAKEVGGILLDYGIDDEQVAAFEEKCDEAFGTEAVFAPQNLVEQKRWEVQTPDVSIRVAPGRGDLVQTRIIDGARYILIRAEEGVEVNGVAIQIRPEPIPSPVETEKDPLST